MSVRVSSWHGHYGEWADATEESSFEEAVEVITGILADRLVVAFAHGPAEIKDRGLLTQSGESELLPPGQAPDLWDSYERIEYMSWSGIHDRSVL